MGMECVRWEEDQWRRNGFKSEGALFVRREAPENFLKVPPHF